MKKTTQIIVMAALCLNFCYGQSKITNLNKGNCATGQAASKSNGNASPQANLPYKYDFSGFKSGYKSGYRISNDDFMKGKSITVRNYTITQLFALALRLHPANDTSTEQARGKDQIVIDVRQPDKLNALHCYQLVVPFYLTDNFYVIMQQSLIEEFPEYVVKMERKGDANCMVIKDRVY